MTKEIAIDDTLLDLQHLSPLICMELAAGLSTPEGVRDKYEITDEQWLRLKGNPVFLSMMKEATLAFSGDMNAGKRIVKKAEILLEEALPILHRIMTNPDTGTTAIIDVVKQLATLAGKTGRSNAEGGLGVGPGFNVEIQIHTNEPARGVIIQGN